MASIDCCRATGRGSHRLASATSSVGFDDTTKPSRGAPPSAPSLLRLASHIQTPYFDHIRHILDNSARSVLLTRPLGGSGAQQVVVGWEHLRTREFSRLLGVSSTAEFSLPQKWQGPQASMSDGFNSSEA
jgi:hypothetical protein